MINFAIQCDEMFLAVGFGTVAFIIMGALVVFLITLSRVGSETRAMRELVRVVLEKNGYDFSNVEKPFLKPPKDGKTGGIIDWLR